MAPGPSKARVRPLPRGPGSARVDVSEGWPHIHSPHDAPKMTRPTRPAGAGPSHGMNALCVIINLGFLHKRGKGALGPRLGKGQASRSNRQHLLRMTGNSLPAGPWLGSEPTRQGQPRPPNPHSESRLPPPISLASSGPPRTHLSLILRPTQDPLLMYSTAAPAPRRPPAAPSSTLSTEQPSEAQLSSLPTKQTVLQSSRRAAAAPPAPLRQAWGPPPGHVLITARVPEVPPLSPGIGMRHVRAGGAAGTLWPAEARPLEASRPQTEALTPPASRRVDRSRRMAVGAAGLWPILSEVGWAALR